ncbi:alanine racemase [Flavobacteriales bacterium]|nr:alanine racemase [Flavobacteriales bacterium]
MPHNHETILYVDLKQLQKNYSYLKSLIPKNTKTIAVVKAHGYGLGDFEISKKLESLGVNALWVADFEEGVNLRKNGIKIPIIVANPGAKSYQTIIDNQLEPVIYNIRLLSIYIKSKTPLNIHLKLNSGMNRYGFDSQELDQLILLLQKNPFLKVSSICSHLSSSNDSSQDGFSKKQIDLFEKSYTKIQQSLGYKTDTHILNSNGVLRFDVNDSAVRLGIALYGISPDSNLKQICSLHSTISQIRNIEKDAKVGYQNAFVAKQAMKIALIPIGYADGINRKLGEGLGSVLIENKICSIIGQVSMDSLMVDISNTNAQEGDDVILFNFQHSLQKIADDLDTIPYEIMATLNKRIKRVYLDE